MLHFSNQWPLKALYNISSHSAIHAHMHTPMAELFMQGDSQLEGEVSRSGTPQHQQELGVELATFRLHVKPPSDCICWFIKECILYT